MSKKHLISNDGGVDKINVFEGTKEAPYVQSTAAITPPPDHKFLKRGGQFLKSTDGKYVIADPTVAETYLTYSAHKERVLDDGGELLSTQNTGNMIHYLKQNSLYDNLVLGISNDFGVKLRNDLGNDYVTKAYDIGESNYDYIQTTESLQPKIVDNEWSLIDSGTLTVPPITIGLNLMNETISFWMKCEFPRLDSLGGSFSNRIVHWGTYYGNNSGGFGLQSGGMSRYIKGSTSSAWSSAGSLGATANSLYDSGGWIFYTVVFESNDTIKFYMNGNHIWSGTIADPFTGYTTNAITFGLNMLSHINDILIPNINLTQSEITALYDFTKNKYGH
jgi:hypothetical protein